MNIIQRYLAVLLLALGLGCSGETPAPARQNAPEASDSTTDDSSPDDYSADDEGSPSAESATI